MSSQVVAWKIANPEDYVWQVLNYAAFNSAPIYSQILWKDRQRNMRYKKNSRGCYTREHFVQLLDLLLLHLLEVAHLTE